MSKYFFAIVLMLCFVGQLVAQDVIQPKDYHSNDGVYTLTVSPSSPDGLTGAEYRMQKNGEKLWSKQLNSTPVKVDVSSAGITLTCDHSTGIRPPFDRMGYMQLSLRDAMGKVIWAQSIKRKSAMRIHGPPEPYCEQVLIRPNTDQALIWYHNDQRTHLKAVDISTGKAIKDFQIDTSFADKLTSVKDIKFHNLGNSGLLLVEVTGWINEENEKGNGYHGYLSDALYYLLNTDGQVFWQQHFLGSLDIRKTSTEENRQKAHQQRDAFLNSSDLIQVQHREHQFAITDYKDQQLHWYQMGQKQKVKAIKSAPLQLPQSPFEVETKQQTSPTLVRTINLQTASENTTKPSSKHYAAIDITSDGSLLLYQEDSHSITKITEQELIPNYISVSQDEMNTDYIPQQLMFVGPNDDVFINLGHDQYAVFDSKGERKQNRVLGTECQEFCFVDQVMQKNTGFMWQENGANGISLLKEDKDQWIKVASIEKDGNGHWFDYIYEIQNDEADRLLMLGRIDNAINLLYVLDAKCSSLATIDLAYGYTNGATLGGDFIFLSDTEDDHIAVLNFSGEVIQRFQTDNQQTPYQLRAYKNKLYAVTQDEVLVYDISTL